MCAAETGKACKYSSATLFEEALRVPLVIYDPRLPKAQRGRVLAQLALNVDLPATFLDWAGVKPPTSYEGRSLAPLIESGASAEWRRHFFCEHLDPHLGGRAR